MIFTTDQVPYHRVLDSKPQLDKTHGKFHNIRKYARNVTHLPNFPPNGKHFFVGYRNVFSFCER